MKDKTNQVWNMFPTGFLKYFSKTRQNQFQYPVSDLKEQISHMYASIYRSMVFLFVSKS